MPAGTWKKAAGKAPERAPAVPLPCAGVTGGRAWRPHALVIPALAAVVLAAYSNSFGAALTFDNHLAIADDARIRAATPANIGLILHEDYWYGHSRSGLYRPVTTLSYLFNYAILGNGANPAAYHWINFLLHAVNAGLVYLLGLAVLRKAPLAVAMAGLWAVHPALTESVTNVVGRADLLAGIGVLAGLLCYIHGAAAAGWRRAAWLAAMAAAVLLGCFSKESAVVVLPAAIIYDCAFAERASWRGRLAAYAVLAGAVAVFLAVRARILTQLPQPIVGVTENPLVGADFLTSRLTAVGVVGKYLWLLVWPLRLSADYSYNQIPLFAWRFTAEDAQTLAALAVCCGLAVLAIAWRLRQPALFFFIAFFFVALAPTANVAILIGTAMADRFLYLPSIAFTGCLVLVVYAACRRVPESWRRAAAPAVLAAIGLAFAARTYARNFDWADEVSLWTSGVRVCPNSYKTHQDLATAWMNARHAPDGITREVDRMLAILDTLPDEQSAAAPYALAGRWYRVRGESMAAAGGAVPYHRKALEILQHGARIDRAEAQKNIAVNRRAGKDIVYFGAGDVHLELGRVYLRLNEPAKALESLDDALLIKPGAEVSVERANAYTAMSDPRRAAIAMLEGLTLEPARISLIPSITRLYRQSDPRGCEVVSRGSLVGLNTECPEVRGDICSASREAIRVLVRLGRRDEAISAARNAVQSAGCPPGALQ
jgi:protein O-mannosyl-transferase